MSKTIVSISEITYNKKEDIRILSACLSNWFTDPKILHFASPNMPYPFNIKKWISMSYKEKNIKTIIIKAEDWIVGHLSIKYEEDKSLAHLFHLHPGDHVQSLQALFYPRNNIHLENLSFL